MHSITSRANAVFSLSSSMVLFLAAVLGIASIINQITPIDLSTRSPIQLSVKSIAIVPSTDELRYRYQAFYHHPRHFGVMHFNCQADLRSLFGWNVKQVHAMITLQYEQQDSIKHNKLTVWDAILSTVDDAHIVLANQPNSYAITDFRFARNRRLDLVPGNLRLEWCVHTWLGAVRCVKGEPVPFTFPKWADTSSQNIAENESVPRI